MIKITLQKIKDHDPCKDGWEKILEAQGPDLDREWPLSDALKSNSFEDVLWALRRLPEHNSLWRKYAIWRARQVEHLMTDEWSKAALYVAWRYSDGEATDDELTAARAAAWDAARDVGDVGDAGAARAAWAATWGAARAAARAAAPEAAARAAATEAAARAAQEKKLKELLDD